MAQRSRRAQQQQERRDAEQASPQLSRSARKRQADAVATMAQHLLKLPESELARLQLDGEVREAIDAARGLKRGALLRQIRFIAKLLRGRDTSSIAAVLGELEARQRANAAREQAHEAWRRRLLAEGDGALAELLRAHPHADAQQLRQLVRQALQTPESPRGVRARRELLRAIRALDERS